MKKLLLGLGTLAAVSAPVAAVVACSSWNNMEIKDLKGTTTMDEAAFSALAKDVNDYTEAYYYLGSVKVTGTLAEQKAKYADLINASKMKATDKPVMIGQINAKTKVEEIAPQILAWITDTNSIKTWFGFGTANIFVKNDNGSISKIVSMSFDEKTKVFTVVTKFINEYNTVNMTHRIHVTFPAPTVTP